MLCTNLLVLMFPPGYHKIISNGFSKNNFLLLCNTSPHVISSMFLSCVILKIGASSNLKACNCYYTNIEMKNVEFFTFAWLDTKPLK